MDNTKDATKPWMMLYNLLDDVKKKMERNFDNKEGHVTEHDYINIVDFFFTNAQNILMSNKIINDETSEEQNLLSGMQPPKDAL